MTKAPTAGTGRRGTWSGDPAGGLAAGRYSDPTVQQLYDSTVASGTSAGSALDAIEHFEQQNLASLQGGRAHTSRADLSALYANLEQASNSHISTCHDGLQPPSSHDMLHHDGAHD